MPTPDDVVAALRDVQDPELPVSIVDLGLVRGVSVDGETITVKLTFTSLACPCTEMIREDVTARLEGLDGVTRVEIQEVFEAWTREHMSDEARAVLRTLAVI